MQIRIDARPIGPLRVLPELPDTPLAIIEGLNGIGKTLTIRLLQLCTGDRSPYPVDSPAWSSLCAGLGEFSVKVAGLRGGHGIEWFADTREWIRSSDDGVAPVPFRRILVDGKVASVDDVRRILAVYRIGGEQGIVETLARQADDQVETVGRWAHRYADQTAGPLASLEGAATNSQRLLGLWSRESYRNLIASADECRAQISAAAQLSEAAKARHAGLTRAL